MERTIVITESQLRRILESPDYGYHAGDLGKSEHFVNHQSGTRGTGHFGTGTYFVGDKGKLACAGYKDRPVEEIDTSGYNLLKIKSADSGFRLHDSLKYINNKAWRQALEDDIDMDALNKACWPLSVLLYSHIRKDEDYGISDIRAFNETVVSKAVGLLEEYAGYVKANGGHVTSSDRNTISTELLKSFGIEGIDARGVPELDNTEFGSVVFDIRKQDRPRPGRILESQEGSLPGFFKPETKNGRVTLYHGLSRDSLDYVLSEGAFVARTCSEGKHGLWFSTARNGDHPSGYECMVSIDVPLQDIGTGYTRPFNVMNSTHVFSEHDIPLDRYPFRILKVGGVALDDEMLAHWKRMADGPESKTFLRILHDGICGGYDSLHHYVMDRIEGTDAEPAR